MITCSKQDISDEDIDSVTEVLKSDFLTQGNQVPLFEDVISNHVGAKYALFCGAEGDLVDIGFEYNSGSNSVFLFPEKIIDYGER